MIFKLKTSAAMPAVNIPKGNPKAAPASNGQLTGLAKSIVDKETKAQQPAATKSLKPVDTPLVDMTANKNDAGLALGKLNPDIKAESTGGTGLVKPNISAAANLRKPVPVFEGAPPVDKVSKPITPEPQRSEINTESDVTEAPATTDVGLAELPTGPMGVDTSMEATIETARTALDKMLTEGADPALRAEAEATLREGEAAAVKDTRKSQALGATGLSGAGGRLESDVRELGRRDTVTAMDEYDRSTRQEEAARINSALGLAGDIQRAELERLAVERARKQMGTVEESENGTLTETLPDGSSRTTSPNGDVTVIKANGDKEITHPDGSKEAVLAPKTQLPPFTGTSVVAGSPGQSRQTFEVRTEQGEGQYTIGSPLYTSEEGYKFKLYRNPDGSVFLMAA
jgi:hypothetical protein